MDDPSGRLFTDGQAGDGHRRGPVDVLADHRPVDRAALPLAARVEELGSMDQVGDVLVE
jgi:hypothetical protein